MKRTIATICLMGLAGCGTPPARAPHGQTSDQAKANAVGGDHELIPAPGTIATRTEKIADGQIRIVTAKMDLTGQRDLKMAGDDGTPVGDAHCTDNLRFSNTSQTQKVSTVLLCWRVSDSRSVVTFATVRTGSPSASASVDLIDKEWDKLG